MVIDLPATQPGVLKLLVAVAPAGGFGGVISVPVAMLVLPQGVISELTAYGKVVGEDVTCCTNLKSDPK